VQFTLVHTGKYCTGQKTN